MNILILIVAILVGIIVGRLTKMKEPSVGTLRIDQSDPDDGPYLFLELVTDPRVLLNKKQVVLDVSTESYITQK